MVYHSVSIAVTSHNLSPSLTRVGDAGAVDNDDGSSWYNIHRKAAFIEPVAQRSFTTRGIDNFMLFGGAKSDWGGHDKRSYSNVYAYPRWDAYRPIPSQSHSRFSVYGEGCWKVIAQAMPQKGHEEGYWNNTCVLTSTGSVYAELPNGCKITKEE